MVKRGYRWSPERGEQEHSGRVNSGAGRGRPRYTGSMGIGRILITIGVLLVVAGALVSLGDRLPLRIGRLPGDIYVQGKNSSFYFPLTTCILLSAVLSLVLWILRRLG